MAANWLYLVIFAGLMPNYVMSDCLSSSLDDKQWRI